MKSITDLNNASIGLSYTDERPSGLVFRRSTVEDKSTTLTNVTENGGGNTFNIPVLADVIDCPQNTTIYYGIQLNLPGGYITADIAPASNTHNVSNHISVFTFANVNHWNQYKQSIRVVNGTGTFDDQFDINIVLSDAGSSSQEFTIYVNQVSENLNWSRAYIKDKTNLLFPDYTPRILDTSDTVNTWTYTLSVPSGSGLLGNSNVYTTSSWASSVNYDITNIYYTPAANTISTVTATYSLAKNGSVKASGTFNIIGEERIEFPTYTPATFIEQKFEASSSPILFVPTTEQKAARADIICIAGGGGGQFRGGGGGGGGYCKIANIALTDNSYVISVGTGGLARTANSSGRAGSGGNTSITGSSSGQIVFLTGGQGGAWTEPGVVDGGNSGNYLGSNVIYRNQPFFSNGSSGNLCYRQPDVSSINANNTLGCMGGIGNITTYGGGGAGLNGTGGAPWWPAGPNGDFSFGTNPYNVINGSGAWNPGGGQGIDGGWPGGSHWNNIFTGRDNPHISFTGPAAETYYVDTHYTKASGNNWVDHPNGLDYVLINNRNYAFSSPGLYLQSWNKSGSGTWFTEELRDHVVCSGGAGYSFNGKLGWGGSTCGGHTYGNTSEGNFTTITSGSPYYIDFKGNASTTAISYGSGGSGGGKYQAAGNGAGGVVIIRFYNI